MDQSMNILLIEKDENLGVLLAEYLQTGNFTTEICPRIDEAYTYLQSGNFSICIIDTALTEEKIFSQARNIRLFNPEIIIIFMGDSSKEDILEAYKCGADDYIKKPLHLEELKARLFAILRRTHKLGPKEKQLFKFGKFTLDANKQTLVSNESSIKLTTKECDLLKYLCQNMNILTERDKILKTVWKNDSYFNARSMDVYITKLRKLLKEDPTLHIVNIHGKGYKLVEKNQEALV